MNTPAPPNAHFPAHWHDPGALRALLERAAQFHRLLAKGGDREQFKTWQASLDILQAGIAILQNNVSATEFPPVTQPPRSTAWPLTLI